MEAALARNLALDVVEEWELSNLRELTQRVEDGEGDPTENFNDALSLAETISLLWTMQTSEFIRNPEQCSNDLGECLMKAWQGTKKSLHNLSDDLRERVRRLDQVLPMPCIRPIVKHIIKNNWHYHALEWTEHLPRLFSGLGNHPPTDLFDRLKTGSIDERVMLAVLLTPCAHEEWTEPYTDVARKTLETIIDYLTADQERREEMRAGFGDDEDVWMKYFNGGGEFAYNDGLPADSHVQYLACLLAKTGRDDAFLEECLELVLDRDTEKDSAYLLYHAVVQSKSESGLIHDMTQTMIEQIKLGHAAPDCILAWQDSIEASMHDAGYEVPDSDNDNDNDEDDEMDASDDSSDEGETANDSSTSDEQASEDEDEEMEE